MRTIKQDYFDKFICASSKCEDTCCQGWQIMIDDNSLERFKKYDGVMKEELHKAVNWRDKMMNYDSSGKCPLLNADGLCRLVIEEGEEFISEICHIYPRHVEEFDGIREWSLSISCPIAAKMLLTAKEPLSYNVIEDDEEEPLYEDFEDFDFMLFTKLEDSRDLIFEILNDRSLSIYSRILAILKLSTALQDCIDEDRIYDMDEIIENFDCSDIRCEAKKLYSIINNQTELLFRFEKLREDWNDVLSDTVSFKENFEVRFDELFSVIKENISGYSHEIVLENLLFTYLFTYYEGAVYDDMLLAKSAMSVYSTLMIDYIVMGQLLINKEMTIDDYINIVYRFARETEHSDINLNLMEEECERMFQMLIE